MRDGNLLSEGPGADSASKVEDSGVADGPRILNPQVAAYFHRDVDAFANCLEVKNGIHVVNYNGEKIDVLVADHGAPVTVVFFHGSMPRESKKPIFVGTNFSGDGIFNRVSVSDPTLVAVPGLKLSWYAGSDRQPRLQEVLRKILARVFASLGTPPERCVFFGSSGGGFAALQIGRYFDGSCSLAMNPQTSIGRFHKGPVEQYLKSSWDVDEPKDLPEHVEHDVIPAYSRKFRNTVLYIQNENDWMHVAYHQRPFFDSADSASAIWSLIRPWNDPKEMMGHTIPPKPVVKEILDKTVASVGDWDAAASSLGFVRR
ncbi:MULTISPECIES: hypothetical protein [Arthrobacter]|uniref:Alpha/beta hydrolase family protein n=2 Tax=Arthrobacter TaxID=1663 RepID=A0ABU9KH68_9MICC|nr:hypothetical protein [Arthrobacter sp. YJM1]MDP5225542.1 hypothetical protein [Arthrobacter sp. YJM1]